MRDWQAYVRDFWAQAQKFHKAGTSWEEAAKLVEVAHLWLASQSGRDGSEAGGS